VVVAEGAEEKVVERGSLRFSATRIEKVRNGRRVTSFARAQVRSIEVKNDSASEHPLRESLWAGALAVGSYSFLSSAWDSGKTSGWLIGGVLALMSGLMVRHLFAKLTVVVIKGDDAQVRLDLEERLTGSEIAALNRELDHFDWPTP
jgi:hypothetical protein